MPLYRIQNGSVTQIKQTGYSRERDLQRLFEDNLEALLGVRYIASEFTTGDRQRGRIDTLGLDQDNYPTIIEFKLSNKENIINQGLFYMDWLVDHKGDFTLAATTKLGMDIKIDWSRPRLILVAESFSDYDKYAVNRIGSNIELWTYRRYGEDLLYLDALFVPSSPASKPAIPQAVTVAAVEIPAVETVDQPTYTLDDHKVRKPQQVINLFEALREWILALGEPGEITEKANKMYIGYKHGKNFCEVHLLTSGLRIWLDMPYAELEDPYALARDVSKIGHYGTGSVEVKVTGIDEMGKVIPLIEQSYNQTV
jgi:predicted transport protein